MVIEGALQLRAVFLASGAMAGGGYAEFHFAGAGCAFGLDGDIPKPFGEAQEWFLHDPKFATLPTVKLSYG
jgi:hypothetical protein